MRPAELKDRPFRHALRLLRASLEEREVDIRSWPVDLETILLGCCERIYHAALKGRGPCIGEAWEVEDAAGWTGPSGLLARVLVEAGWIELREDGLHWLQDWYTTRATDAAIKTRKREIAKLVGIRRSESPLATVTRMVEAGVVPSTLEDGFDADAAREWWRRQRRGPSDAGAVRLEGTTGQAALPTGPMGLVQPAAPRGA